ncbi:HAD hydrolase family protein [bacterium]|nr:HAD hydrolase family protein [bacterium]MBR2652530.1 HAD hydrolase family protein [bacterium]
MSNENSYAFGDSKNDIILLSNIGNSICMGNGEPEVKNVAKYVIGDNNSDAIAEFLYKLVENEK